MVIFCGLLTYFTEIKYNYCRKFNLLEHLKIIIFIYKTKFAVCFNNKELNTFTHAIKLTVTSETLL